MSSVPKLFRSIFIFKHWPFFLFVLALVIKIYGGTELFFWNIDEDRFALTAKRIVVDFKPVLIGYSLPKDIYLGPIFPYILSFWYFISGMNPFNLHIIASILTAFTTVLVYFVGKTIFESKRIGIIASSIYATSALAFVYSKVLTELTIAPILSLFVYLILYQNLKLKKPKNLIWLGFVLTIALQNEGSSFSLIALVGIVWLIHRFTFPLKKFAIILIAVIFSHLSLLFFDIRHNFFLANSFLSFFSGGVSGTGSFLTLENLVNSLQIFPNTLSRFLVLSGEKSVSSQILPCQDLMENRLSLITPAAFSLALVNLTYFTYSSIFNKKRNLGRQIVFIHFVILFIGLFVFNIFNGSWFFEWILVIFFPGFSFIVAYFVDNIFKNIKFGNILTLMIIGFLIGINLIFIYQFRDNFGLKSKALAVRTAIAEIGTRDFYLDSLGSCHSQGYNYLFWYYGNFPKQSYTDDYFTPAYYQKSAKRPKLGVVMVGPSQVESHKFYEKYNRYKNISIKELHQESIEILIIDEK